MEEVIEYFTNEELDPENKGKHIIKSKVLKINKKKEGKETIFDEYGNILSELVYCDDKLVDGEHVIKNENIIIKFNTINNELNGDYNVLRNSNEQIIIEKSTYINNAINGEYKEYNCENEIEFYCNYKNGKLHGNFKHYNHWSREIQIDGYYKHDFLDGIYIELNEDICKYCDKIYFYKSGELDGKCKDFYKNGYLSKISFYKNGKLDGESKEFNCKGILIKKSYYNNGELVNEIINFNNYEIKQEYKKFNNMVCNIFNYNNHIKFYNDFMRNQKNPINYCIFKFLKNIKYKNIQSIKEKFDINDYWSPIL
jgi:antitoxin component YwqK of YwqJK toxin-antitoxin module